MKKCTAKFQADEMFKAVQACNKIIVKRNVIPIISQILMSFDAKKSRISLMATDLDIQIELFVDAEISKSFQITANPISLTRFLRGETAQVSVEFDVKQDIIEWLVSGCSMRQRHLLPPEDFPKFSKKATSRKAIIPQEVMYQALSHTSMCISNEEKRYYLMGAYFHEVNGKLCIVTTDGITLAKFTTQIDFDLGNEIIPTKLIQVLSAMVKTGGNEPLSIKLGERCGEVNLGDRTLKFKCIDGEYPDYNRVFPKEYGAIETTLSASQLSKFSGRNPTVKIAPDEGFIRSNDGQGLEMSVPITGKGGSFGLNLNYLSSFLNKSSVINLKGTSARDPFMVFPENPDCQYIIMPMHV